MAGYLGTKAVLLSTTAADVVGNAEIGGDLTVGGAFTSQGIDDNASATAMTLDASGNVGIGVVPSAWGNVNKVVQVNGGALTSNGLAHSRLSSNLYYDATNTAKSLDVNSAVSYEQVFDGSHRFYSSATAGSAGATVTMQERMRIDPNGNLKIGTTGLYAGNGNEFYTAGGQTNTLIIQGDANPSQGCLGLLHHSTSGTRKMLAFYNQTPSEVGTITQNGTSTSYNTTSDYRLKEDVQPMTGASDRVLALKPVNFAWKADGSRVDGFLAHELQEVIQEAATGAKDAMRDEQYEVTPAVYEDVVIPAVLDEEGNELEAERTEQRLVSEAVMGTRSVPDYQGIDQSKLVPLLTAALQEALTEIADLKARVTALEAV